MQSAEVLWAIKTPVVHYSSNGSTGTDKLFVKMFARQPDSQAVSVWEDKVLLRNKLWTCPLFSRATHEKTAGSRNKVCDFISIIIKQSSSKGVNGLNCTSLG